MYRILAEILTGIVCLFAFWKWSETRAEKKFEKKRADENEKDAEISVQPFVDRPLSRMRNKKK